MTEPQADYTVPLQPVPPVRVTRHAPRGTMRDVTDLPPDVLAFIRLCVQIARRHAGEGTNGNRD